MEAFEPLVCSFHGPASDQRLTADAHRWVQLALGGQRREPAVDTRRFASHVEIVPDTILQRVILDTDIILLHETLADDDLKAIQTYLQQPCALGRDDFRAMVEAKIQRFASIKLAHRPPHPNSNGCE